MIIIDGMDDEPNSSLGGKTPKEVAYMPALKNMKNFGISEMITSVPAGLKPSTDVALLNILGCSIKNCNVGRSWFEAIGAGIDVGDEDLCLRCNIIKMKDNIVLGHSTDILSDDEISKIIEFLNKSYGTDRLKFYPGKGYRTHLIIKNCDCIFKSIPPHELVGESASLLNVDCADKELQTLLNTIIINAPIVLREKGFNNIGIALWSADKKPVFNFKHIDGAVVAGVNLVKGIGRAFGMSSIEVDGATGERNTNLSGKFKAAVNALEAHDFVLLHVEAPDEVSHNKNPHEKIKVLEEIDKYILSPLLDLKKDMEIVVQSDHATSSITGQHLDIPVERITYQIRETYES